MNGVAVMIIFAPWGKARPSEDGPSFHPAVCHMLDVAACADELLRVSPLRRVPRSAAVTLLIALHDIGKISRGFQGKVMALWPAAFGPRSDAVPDTRHDAVGLWMLRRSRRVAALFPNLNRIELYPVLQAVAGHHGSPVDADGILFDAQIGREAESLARDIETALFDLLRPEPLTIAPAEVAAFSFEVACLTTLADWVGSSADWFPYASPGSLAGYWTDVAQPAARRAVVEAGLAPKPIAPFAGIRVLFPFIAEPTPLQRWAETVPLPEGPSLTIVEDMTGSGKSEAALTLAWRLVAAGRGDGCYFALPTMASANAMFQRLGAACGRMFVGGRIPVLALVHSRAKLVSDARDWLTRSTKTAFLAQIGAGTVDQAILSVLPVRHQALRLGALARRVLIVDEAHAYDSYMSRELEELLHFHARLGGSAIVLSATLPATTRARIVAAFQRGLS